MNTKVDLGIHERQDRLASQYDGKITFTTKLVGEEGIITVTRIGAIEGISQFMLFAAMYSESGDKLNSVTVGNGVVTAQDVVEYTIAIPAHGTEDKVKLMFWNANYSPIINTITLPETM